MIARSSHRRACAVPTTIPRKALHRTGKPMPPSNPQPEPYWFFFSYARDDSDEKLERFFKDLSDEVRIQKGLDAKASLIGFRDTRSIKTGDDWPTEMKQALQTSRVLVSIA